MSEDNTRGAGDLPRVVYDCMVFLQGLIREAGPAVTCLELFERGVVRLLISYEVLDEVQDVLTRPKLRRKFPRLTDRRVSAQREMLLERAEFVDVSRARCTLQRDPKDEKYLNLAFAGNAQFIVTRDKDLLDLMDPNCREGSEFRERFPALTILDPVEFLHRMRSAPEVEPVLGE